MDKVSQTAVPVLIFIIIMMGFVKKIKIYDTFLEGAKKGLNTSFSIAAPIVGLLSGVYMLRMSGTIDALCSWLAPLTDFFKIPKEVLPLALLRPISGSGAVAVLSDILKNNGPDGKIGLISSVLSGSTETTFYTIAVYFGAVGVKNIRYTAIAAVIADISAVIIAASVVNYLF